MTSRRAGGPDPQAGDPARQQERGVPRGEPADRARGGSEGDPRNARLVEIVNFQPWDPKQPYSANQVLGPRRYAAFVAARTGDPALIDLGPAPAIDDAGEQLRKAVSDPDNDRAAEIGHALYALTLAKIAPALGGATRVLIAPDGALDVVPFSALVDDRGEFLVER